MLNNIQTPDYDDFLPKHRGRSRNNMQMIRIDNYVGLRYNITDPNADFEIYNIPLDTHQAQNLAMESDMDSLQYFFKQKVLQMRRTNASAPRPYDSLPVPAIKLSNPKIGLQWLGFSEDYPWLPNLTNMKPETSGITSGLTDFNFSALPEDYYLLKGYIRIPEDGTYSFTFSAAEKALIRLHDATLVDADYGYIPNTEIKETMVLQKGFHPILIFIQNKDRNKNPIQLHWQKSGTDNPEDIRFYVE